MPVLVDTSVWVDYFDGRVTPQTEWVDRALGTEPLVVGDLIVGEVLRGFGGKGWEEARKAMQRFRVYAIGGLELTLRCAELQRQLRAKHALLPGQVDCLIATFCLEAGFPLLHSDPVFEPFEQHLGLQTPSL